MYKNKSRIKHYRSRFSKKFLFNKIKSQILRISLACKLAKASSVQESHVIRKINTYVSWVLCFDKCTRWLTCDEANSIYSMTSKDLFFISNNQTNWNSNVTSFQYRFIQDKRFKEFCEKQLIPLIQYITKTPLRC